MYRKIVHYWYNDWLDQRKDLTIRNDLDRFPVVVSLNESTHNPDNRYDLHIHPQVDLPKDMVEHMQACGITAYAVISEADARTSNHRVNWYNLFVGFRTHKEAVMFRLIQPDHEF